MIWQKAADWFGCRSLDPIGWQNPESSKEMWIAVVSKTTAGQMKGIKSMMIMVS